MRDINEEMWVREHRFVTIKDDELDHGLYIVEDILAPDVKIKAHRAKDAESFWVNIDRISGEIPWLINVSGV